MAAEKMMAAVQAEKCKRKIPPWLRRDIYLYMMLVLPIAYYIIFCYIPMYGTTIAFKDYNIFDGMFKSEWIGFETFKSIFRMKEFSRAVFNTLRLNFLSLIFGFPSPIILALMLNEVKSKWFKKSVQTILYLPHFISWVIIGGFVTQIFSTNTGILNNLIKSFGGAPVEFLTDGTLWICTYTFMGIWQGIGWGAIVYLAAITGVSQDIYEAATVDGCGRIRMIFKITLPSIKPTIATMFILQVGKIMNIGLDQPIMLSNSLVMEQADVISTFVYRVGLSGADFSVATAVGLFQSVVGLIMLVAANTVVKRLGEEGIW